MFFSRDKTGKVGNFRYKYRRQFILTTPTNGTQSKYDCRDESSTCHADQIS